MNRVILGLGSNRSFLLDGVELSPAEILKEACIRLEKIFSDPVRSSVYKTKAMYVTDQDDFYNMAFCGYTELDPEEVLAKTQTVEAELGRNRAMEIRNGPRSLDIDIELFSDESGQNISVDEPDLEIPHPRLKEREFILVPLLEILEKYPDKEEWKFYSEALKKLPDQGVSYYGTICN